ncbi:MAG: mannose-1-phosphate guanylyltransferase/mannose-6-phosphate isomerase [Alphaproteobacteria bacterium]
MIVPLLLAGGVGVRLWPASRDTYPKQLLNIGGDRSLLQSAALRALAHAPAERIVTVTTETQYFLVADQLGELDPGFARHVIAEPEGRNTAAAVALGALYAERTFGPDAILWVAAADHVIGDEPALDRAVETACRAARQGFLVTFGITPESPDPEFGYIKGGAPIGGVDGALAITRFIEKPPREEAERLIAGGQAWWNSGMFVFSARRILEEFDASAPEVMAPVRKAFAAAKAEASPLRVAREAYAAVPALPVDKAVMERSRRAAVVPCDPRWSDVGNWDRLWRVSAKDAAGNVVQGDGILEGTRDSLVRADGRLVALAGVADIVVVETADAVLVADRRDSAGVKALVDRLKAAKRPEATAHLHERRPWGSFAVLLEGGRYKIKEIVVKPGGRLSLQMHHHRSEHWVVIDGTARVTRDDEVATLAANESTYIGQGVRHRLENPGATPLRIVEVQCGSYVGEDDIVRFEDSYGRVR